MFKQMLLQIGIEAAIEALKNPKKKKFREWLFSEKVKKTVADFTQAYAYAESQTEAEEEEK